jgi:hypothetical protein
VVASLFATRVLHSENTAAHPVGASGRSSYRRFAAVTVGVEAQAA